jgi:hypothetical protein
MNYLTLWLLLIKGYFTAMFPLAWFAGLTHRALHGAPAHLYLRRQWRRQAQVSAGIWITKGVLVRRTPVLRLIDYAIFGSFGRDGSEFMESVCQIGLFRL